MRNKKFLVIASVVVLSMVLSACGPTPTPATIIQTVEVPVVVTETVIQTQEVQVPVVVTATPLPKEQKLEIFHWWTAPGEREAADAMFAAFNAAYPDITVVENPVPGGGGTEHRVVLKARITAGIPPDTFQTLGGAELKDYVDSGVLQPLDDFYASTGYADLIPKPLLNAVTINGHPYSVPLNMHLENILYYNLKLFNELGLTAPTGYDEFVADCEAIKAAKPDMVCLAVGSKDNWSDVFVLDTIMMELGGPEYYVKFFKGEIDVATDLIFKESLQKYAALQQYSNMNDHSTLTWDQAVSAVGSGQAAMTIMGTWAIGAFTKGSNWQPGVDFGAVNYPTKPERLWMHSWRSRSSGVPGLAECCGFTRITDPDRCHPGRNVRPYRYRSNGISGSYPPGNATICKCES
jgi:glucose/mannose transport system substrate-binding protein